MLKGAHTLAFALAGPNRDIRCGLKNRLPYVSLKFSLSSSNDETLAAPLPQGLVGSCPFFYSLRTLSYIWYQVVFSQDVTPFSVSPQIRGRFAEYLFFPQHLFGSRRSLPIP